MSKRNPRAKWVLPQVVDPPRKICFQIQVPDERYHIAAFLGALYNLTSAIFWSDDSAHTAKDVARVWQDIYDNISRQCVTEFINTYVGLEDNMPFFRQVCENDVCYLEFECCPGEWVRLGNANQIPAATQPGSTTPQPVPGGGHVDYPCTTLNANGQYLVPTVVSTGDVINITATGSGNDGGEIAWRCADGAVYFAGLCNEFETRLVGTDPINTYPHMSIILNVGGTFYAPTSGSFTVPGGVSNAQVYVQVNDSNISNNLGSYSVCITVTNNQIPNYCSTFNFDIAANAFLPMLQTVSNNPFASWVGGSGWDSLLSTDAPTTPHVNTIGIIRVVTATIISVSAIVTTSVPMTWQIIVNGDAYSVGGTTLATGSVSGVNQTISWSGAPTAITSLLLFLIEQTNGLSHPAVAKTMQVCGTGSNPF